MGNWALNLHRQNHLNLKGSCTAFIGLGSNLANPLQQVQKGVAALSHLPQTQLLACSPFYRSAPIGYLDQPDFVNAVVAINTELMPHVLLEALLTIERLEGRLRSFANAPRTLDLDLLLYEDYCCHEAGLTLPHPRMHERAFVLKPLSDLAPGLVIPGHGMVEHCLLQCVEQGLKVLSTPLI